MPSQINETLWSHESEIGVLSVVLAEGRMDSAIELIPSAECFHKPAHQTIWEAALALYSRGDVTDWRAVSGALDDVSKIGGTATLIDIAEAYPGTSGHLETHARIVRDFYVRRRLIGVCGEIASDCYKSDDVKSTLNDAERRIYDITIGAAASKIQHISEIMPATLAEIDAWQTGEIQKTLVPTGFTDFDNLAVGFMPGDMIVLAGQTSHGKTQAAIQIARNVAYSGKQVVILSLEMRNLEVNKRVVLADARVDGMKIKRRQLTDEDWDRITQSGNRLCGQGIHYIDDTSVTVNDLRSLCRKLRGDGEIGLIVVDYLQLMSPDVSASTREQEVARVSRGCKWLAKDIGCPVMALSQFRKTDGNRKPSLNDLRESGAIGHDADWVMFVWRDPDNRFWWLLKKARHGCVGDVEMNFVNGRWECLADAVEL